MNKLTQNELKNSHKLLNEYYLQKYNTQMGRLSKFVSQQIFIEEDDADTVIDEQQEILFEQKQSLEKSKSKLANSKKRSQSGEIIRKLSESKQGYSKKSPHKPKRQKEEKTQSSSPNEKDIKIQIQQIIQQKLKPIKRELFDFNKPLNSIHEVSETESLFGPPKSMLSSKSKQLSVISAIQKPGTDYQTRSIGQKSYYSAAIQSKLSKGSPLRKSKREKKNFKKVFLQKKYQTSNLNQTFHKSQHQSELHIRQNVHPEVANFSIMTHQRRQDQEDKKQQIMLVKDFKKVSESLSRQLNEEGSPGKHPQVPEGKSTLLVTKPIKELLVDNTSIFQNVDVKEYEDSDAVYSDDGQIPEQSQFHQAIGQVFEKRFEYSRKTSPLKIAKQDQYPQEPSIPPQKISEREENSSVISDQHNMNTNITPEKNRISIQDAQKITMNKKYDRQAEQARRKQEEQIKVAQQLKERRERLEEQKQQIMIDIISKERNILNSSINKICNLLLSPNIHLSIQENLVSTARKLVQDSDDLMAKIANKSQEVELKMQQISHLIDGRVIVNNTQGKRREYQLFDEVEALLRNPQHIQAETPENQHKLVEINKSLIKRLIQKCCQVIENKVVERNEIV